MGKTYVGNNPIIIIDMQTDVTAATTTNLLVMKPGATSSVTWEAEVYNTNYLKYETVEAVDISVSGRYRVQPDVVTPTFIGKGETVYFTAAKDYA